MPAVSPTTAVRNQWTQDQWHDFERLRVRYQWARDLVSAREWARLRFLRWLVQTGRLVS
jgi:hypothetical protein